MLNNALITIILLYININNNQWQTTPKNLPSVQRVAYQSHTGRPTGLWFLPRLAQGLNTNNNKKYF